MRKFFIMSFIMFLSFPAHSEKWVNVGTAVAPSGSSDIYADADSAVRTGDLAKINFKAVVDQKVDEFSFDCKKDLMISNFGDVFSTDKPLVGKGGTVTWPVPLIKNIQALACKRSFEFWK